MIVPSNIEFKYPDLVKEYQSIDSRLQLILEDMAGWVKGRGYKFVITDLLSEEWEDKELKRVSTSHREGRAADVRVRDWPIDFRHEFEAYFELKYKKWAATSAKSGLRNLIVIHSNGNGIHCHIQVSRKES